MRAHLVFSRRRRTPLVLQTEAAECGLACLAMVAAFHGYRTDLSTLRSRHSVSLKGTTLSGLIKIAAQLGLNSRPLRLDLGAVSRLQLPVILHWDLNHFVVLTEIRRQHVVILDPAVGRRTLSLREFSTHFTGVALETAPDVGRNELVVTARSPFQGAKVSTITPAVADELHLDADTEGVVITALGGDSAAANVGFQKGDIILAVNNQKIAKTSDLDKASKVTSRLWRIVVVRGGQQINVTLGG